MLGTSQGACNPSYPDLCLPPTGPDINCGDAVLQGRTDFRVIEPDTYGLDDSNGVGNGVGCESDSSGTSGSGAVRTTAGTSGSGGLASTGSSGTLALTLFALGLMSLGGSFLTSEAGKRWYATSNPEVRYTIDRVVRRRR